MLNASNNPDSSFAACPRYHDGRLSKEAIDHIATLAATRAAEVMRDNLYRGVGAAVINRALWIMGALTVAIAIWLSGKGLLNIN